jgi:hypothetical protein
MNIRVGSVVVAERLLPPAISGLEDEPGVSRRTQLLLSNRHSELAWHIEPGSRWRIPVDLQSREVVNGVAAPLDQSKNPIEPGARSGSVSAPRIWSLASERGGPGSPEQPHPGFYRIAK